MPLSNFLPGLPLPLSHILVLVVGILGAILLAYAILLEAERRQDAVFVLGSAALFVYALIKGDYIFMLTTALIFIVAGRELIQILRGKHHHSSKDVQTYEHPEQF